MRKVAQIRVAQCYKAGSKSSEKCDPPAVACRAYFWQPTASNKVAQLAICRLNLATCSMPRVCVCVCVCVACPILGGLLCLSVCSLPLMDNLPRSACHVTTPIGSLHAADKRPGPGLPSRGSRQAGRPLPLQPPHCGWVGFDVGGVRIKLAAWRYFVPHATPVQFVRWSHFERFISGPRHATNRLETGRRPVINNIRTCRRLAHCFSRRPTY